MVLSYNRIYFYDNGTFGRRIFGMVAAQRKSIAEAIHG